MRRILAWLMVFACLLAYASADGVPPRERKAVEKALDFLVSSQDEDGSWGPLGYDSNPGVVALCALAFMGYGVEMGLGKYGTAAKRAIDYILESQDEDGLIAGRGAHSMYAHGFATLALAEAYGMYPGKKLGKALKKAVEVIVKAQNATGGWRYTPTSRDADITVTGCQMVALKAARNAGIEVPDETIEKGLRYVKSCATPSGGFTYQAGRPFGAGTARTGIAVTVMSLCGMRDSPEAKRGITYLLARPEEKSGYYYYGAYYCAQAVFQAGTEEECRQWRDAVIGTLLLRQRSDGAWEGGVAGTVCSTAMAVLALEVTWRLLPVYQK